MGGGSTLDIRINIASLGLGEWSGRSMECGCHRDHHDGNEPTRDDLLARVANREGALQRDIDAVIRLIMRLDKHASARALEWAICLELTNDAQRAICRRTLREHGKL
jgi:hypothetical protein